MQVKSAAWWATLTAGAVDWRYGVDILASDEQTPLEDPLVFDQNAADRLVPQSASVSLDVTAPTHRKFSLSLRNSDGRYLTGAAGYPSGGTGSPTANGLVWFNTRYRPWIDLRVGFNNGVKVYDRTYLGIYTLLNPEAQVQTVGSMMHLELLDKASLLQKPYLISNSTMPTFTKNGHTVGGYASGTTFDAAMSDLATRAGVPAAKQNFSPSTLALPADYSIQEGTDWWTYLQALAGSIAHVLYFDGFGNLVRRPDPLLQNAPSVLTFAPGPNSITKSVTRKTDLQNTYNHVIVVGGSSTSSTVRGEAQVQDPSSPYHANQIGDRIVYVGAGGKIGDMTPDPTIGTTGQATTRAQVWLARLVGQQEAVTIAARTIPALEPYDRVTVNSSLAGLALDFMATQVVWNLAHDGMTLDASRWFTVGS